MDQTVNIATGRASKTIATARDSSSGAREVREVCHDNDGRGSTSRPRYYERSKNPHCNHKKLKVTTAATKQKDEQSCDIPSDMINCDEQEGNHHTKNNRLKHHMKNGTKYDRSKDEEEKQMKKYQRRLALNRIRGKKSRNKIKIHLQTMKVRKKELEEKNELLKKEASIFKQQVSKLVKVLMESEKHLSQQQQETVKRIRSRQQQANNDYHDHISTASTSMANANACDYTNATSSPATDTKENVDDQDQESSCSSILLSDGTTTISMTDTTTNDVNNTLRNQQQHHHHQQQQQQSFSSVTGTATVDNTLHNNIDVLLAADMIIRMSGEHNKELNQHSQQQQPLNSAATTTAITNTTSEGDTSTDALLDASMICSVHRNLNQQQDQQQQQPFSSTAAAIADTPAVVDNNALTHALLATLSAAATATSSSVNAPSVQNNTNNEYMRILLNQQGLTPSTNAAANIHTPPPQQQSSLSPQYALGLNALWSTFNEQQNMLGLSSTVTRVGAEPTSSATSTTTTTFPNQSNLISTPLQQQYLTSASLLSSLFQNHATNLSIPYNTDMITPAISSSAAGEAYQCQQQQYCGAGWQDLVQLQVINILQQDQQLSTNILAMLTKIIQNQESSLNSTQSNVPLSPDCISSMGATNTVNNQAAPLQQQQQQPFLFSLIAGELIRNQGIQQQRLLQQQLLLSQLVGNTNITTPNQLQYQQESPTETTKIATPSKNEK